MTFFSEYKRGDDFFSSKKKGVATFFHRNKKGAQSFFQRKKRGRGLRFQEKKGGTEFFTRGKIPQTRPGYRVNFGRSLTCFEDAHKILILAVCVP